MNHCKVDTYSVLSQTGDPQNWEDVHLKQRESTSVFASTPTSTEMGHLGFIIIPIIAFHGPTPALNKF